MRGTRHILKFGRWDKVRRKDKAEWESLYLQFPRSGVLGRSVLVEDPEWMNSRYLDSRDISKAPWMFRRDPYFCSWRARASDILDPEEILSALMRKLELSVRNERNGKHALGVSCMTLKHSQHRCNGKHTWSESEYCPVGQRDLIFGTHGVKLMLQKSALRGIQRARKLNDRKIKSERLDSRWRRSLTRLNARFVGGHREYPKRVTPRLGMH
jgi:hypothetical protein